MKFVGHQDLIRLFHRAFRRIKIRLDLFQRISSSSQTQIFASLALGVESRAEYLDFDAVNPTPKCSGHFPGIAGASSHRDRAA